MSDTPRTDALIRGQLVGPIQYGNLLDLARTLERELSAKTAECERLREALQKIASCKSLFRGDVVDVARTWP